MASVIAEVTVVGQVGKVYELRRTKDDRANIDFSVAVTPRKNNNGTWEDGDTTWHNIKAWGRVAENIEKSLNSGDRVIVKGYFTLRKEFTKDDGTVLPARNQFVATHVGIELGFDPAHSERQSKNGGAKSSSNTSSAQKSEPKAEKKEPVNNDSLDDLDDLDLDLESPF